MRHCASGFVFLLKNNNSSVRRKTIILLSLLIGFNLLSWSVALLLYHGHPLLLGAALLAYGLGLRHAFDLDHIATIDNVIRKLMHEGKRPLAAGVFFSLGHSTIVLAMTLLIALVARETQHHFSAVMEIGKMIGTSVSALFLLAIGLANTIVLLAGLQKVRTERGGGAAGPAVSSLHHHRQLAGFLQCLIQFVRQPWQMYVVGVLFALGFDTATEIGVLSLSAGEAARGMPLWNVLIFPMLFAAAMSLADGSDGVLMVGAYRWALVDPTRRTYYGLTVTALSVVIALVVGGIELAAILPDRFQLANAAGRVMAGLGPISYLLGFCIVGTFMACWLASILFQLNRRKRLVS